MPKRHHRVENGRTFTAGNEDSQALMDTSIGSDGERSDNDYEDLTPSTTPDASKRRSNDYMYKLKFSIENILKPDFGRQKNTGTSETSDSPPTFATTPSPLSSPRCMTNGHKTGGANGQNSTPEPLLANVKSGSVTPAPSTPTLWPAWVYCTRYSDRPSSGPRCRRVKRTKAKQEEKRPRTAFTVEQLSRLKAEFQANRYLTEKRRQDLATDLGLNESQIKIWFQNKRAKIKKQTGARNILALHLMAQGLYNHATVPVVTDDTSPDDDGDTMDNDECSSMDQFNMTDTDS